MITLAFLGISLLDEPLLQALTEATPRTTAAAIAGIREVDDTVEP
ncbi:hypothetical protein MPHL43072_17320 [Mycolicibacterium phlei DSM 43072]|uniref:Uncharacterized protein n=1 Tax=Mycolicibacterium phlei DSM 43239 = CCUG 21000 TaxID=1226750 RepID=A0A5N5V5G5_MYCPH|nr:hypothetical protein MPHL21000_11835 [Mycolicibacterium phlei DSM 43239 = CCUG 21000]KXW61722.1 hypothetical protein MPHL43239_19525 [Mycolicibacterium phlei DSM 43239 = CCUG 21000]KXW65519.1 hypothetical protein MPHL43070_04890 [Mycolicibacterium phlei DSM 43070]KXW70875.1 hypothetical protein MPHL43072_17320 [Mycolicibacterium phlei DSM 43072]